MSTKTIFEIIPNDAEIEVRGDLHTSINGITLDSRAVEKGYLFIAIKGHQTDGHQYIASALDRGAVAILCNEDYDQNHDNVVMVRCSNTRKLVGRVAHAYYDYPSERLRLIGVTGTNGKTTIATLLHQLYGRLGYASGLVSTVHNLVGDRIIPATHTTPDPVSLNALLRQMVDAGCDYAFMEVSSHALDQGRVDGLQFESAIFSNISHDHLDYHGSFKEYIRAKKLLFDHLDIGATAIVNMDDRNGSVMVQNCKASIKTFSLRNLADYRCKIIGDRLEGLHLLIDGEEVFFRLSGAFNAYNILAVLATAVEDGQDKATVLTVLSDLKGAQGRMQRVDNQRGINAFVDYAHTPDALENVLKTIQGSNRQGGKIILVVGAGGDRDKTKRPLMGRIASQLADKVIFTNDNPRTEDPEDILNDIVAGVDQKYKNKVLRITDRGQAIKTAVMLAGPQDTILVAGKGHEDYQDIQGKKLPFDDRLHLFDALQ